jgi:trk system potassium uptake protein
MYIVIAGGGQVGLGLAEKLVQKKHDVLLIDIDKTVCDFAQYEIGMMSSCGSATDLKVLENSGLARADVVIAALGLDSDNLAFLLLAKSLGVGKRLVRVQNTSYTEAYKLAGATTLTSAVDPVVEQMMLHLEYPEIKSLMRIGKGNIDIFELLVPQDSLLANQPIAEIVKTPQWPDSCTFVAVETGLDQWEIAKGQTVVPGGGHVLLLAQEQDLITLLKAIAITV